MVMSLLDGGAAHAQQALAQAEALGDQTGATMALCFAGRIAAKSDNTAPGEALLHQGLARTRALLQSVWRSALATPHRILVPELIDVCASFALRLGCPAEAVRLHAASAAQHSAIHLPLTHNQDKRPDAVPLGLAVSGGAAACTAVLFEAVNAVEHCGLQRHR